MTYVCAESALETWKELEARNASGGLEVHGLPVGVAEVDGSSWRNFPGLWFCVFGPDFGDLRLWNPGERLDGAIVHLPVQCGQRLLKVYGYTDGVWPSETTSGRGKFLESLDVVVWTQICLVTDRPPIPVTCYGYVRSAGKSGVVITRTTREAALDMRDPVRVARRVAGRFVRGSNG